MSRLTPGMLRKSALLMLAASLTALLGMNLCAAERSRPSKGKEQTAEQLAESTKKALVSIVQFGRDGKENGLGSGFVVSSNGLIATCLHVIGEGRAVSVQFADGTAHEVLAIHASDRKLDLAVLQIAATNLPVLPLGDSGEVKQGTPVVAMGNPLGLRHSIVQGIVSAKREFEGIEMIQIAIPIESGNSGGPLLDMGGRVQGVLALKSALSPNLGFATPVNVLKGLLDKPNPIPMNRWVTLGALNPGKWTTFFGARWTQRGETIQVEKPGEGFGGRALCLSRQKVSANSYEVKVQVKLDDEGGAAGLVFGADGADKHYGFYPSGGQIRLTRFDGPNVFSWTILAQIKTPHYYSGEWNALKVRVTGKRIQGYVNDHLVVEATNNAFAGGGVGLAKFRETKAAFRGFRIDSGVRETESGAPPPLVEMLTRAIESGDEDLMANEEIAKNADISAPLLRRRAIYLEREAARLKGVALALQRMEVQKQLTNELAQTDDKINLFRASLLIGKFDHPEIEIESYEQQLETMAQNLKSEMPQNEKARVQKLIQYLFEENGYHGSRTDYYDQANSYMHQVLDDREGLPISLSVLVMELGKRVGITNLAGIPFPGHFMVQWKGPGSEQFIDAYDRGKQLSREQASELIAELTGRAPLNYKPATKREIILRMLRNLYGVAARDENLTAALGYLDLIVGISPDDPADRMNRGLLRLRLGLTKQAKADFKHLLEEKPEGINLERLSELYRSLEE